MSTEALEIYPAELYRGTLERIKFKPRLSDYDHKRISSVQIWTKHHSMMDRPMVGELVTPEHVMGLINKPESIESVTYEPTTDRFLVKEVRGTPWYVSRRREGDHVR